MTHIFLEFFPQFERGHLFVLRILIVVIREAPPVLHHSHGSEDSKLRSLLHSVLYSLDIMNFLRSVLSIDFFVIFSKNIHFPLKNLFIALSKL